MVSVGQLVELHVDKPAAGGRMIARAEGQIVFVSGAVPGERITARISRVAKGVAFAETVSVEEPSPDRRAPFTDPACGGTAYAHIDYERQLTIKAEVVTDGLIRIGRLVPPPAVQVAGSRSDGYRMRARLHLQGGRIGFFRETSHQLCDARATRQLLPETCDVVEQVAARLDAARIDDVRELEVSENVDATARAVHLESASPIDMARLSGLADIPGLSGVSLTAPMVVRGVPETHLVTGDPYVVDTLTVENATISLRRHVRSFFQGNRYLLSDLVRHIVALVARDQRLLDLYAGVGVFAVAAARSRGASVVAVEGDPYAARDLAINAEATGGIEVHHQSIEAFLARRRQPPDVVVLDPPRTGVSPVGLGGLIALSAPRIVYVSCDIATMGRDVRKLVEAGYRVDQVSAFDLFPNTPHVETVMALSRG